MLPDGRTVLFTSLTAGSHPTSRIESVSLSSGKRRIIVERGTFPLYAQSGHLIFFRDSTLIASPFDVTRLETTGPAVRLVENLTAVGGAVPLAAVSGTGALIYALNAASNRLVSVTREGVERPLSAIPRSYSWARLAPDGRRIALQVGAGEVWVQDTARDTLTPLTTSDMLAAGFPVWTPDGNRILFRSATGIRWVETGASGRGEAIPGTSILDFPTAISSDGATLAFTRTGSADTSSDVYVLSLRGEPNPRPLIKTPAYEGGAQFSTDGRWVAYASNESGQFQVYVRPLPGLEQRSQVSTEGGTAPLWNRNGRELFYRSGNKMMAVDVSATPGLTLSQPRLLFDQPYFFGGNITAANYDISPDGQWFVMIKEEPGASRLTVVLNWFEELKARVPTK